MRTSFLRQASQTVRRVGRDLLEILLPGACCLCQGEVSNYRHPYVLCDRCQLELPQWRKCVRCSAVLAHANELSSENCPACHHLSLPFESITAVGNYEGALGEAILNSKTSRGAASAWDLGQLLAQQLPTDWSPEPMVVAVPMHWTRRIRRGMSSAAVIAQSLAAYKNWKSEKLVACHRRLAKQSELSFTARKRNVQGAFQVVGALATDQPILLVDDILTTGSTLSELAKTLRRAGAAAIHVAVVARSTGAFSDV
ncbi:ComF family protein [Bremerella cremea]|uniref:ComF family protein n=1 Tax=Bremerella cremea TaxID=1031537 RepID=A0A368KTK3_9BACT|nr:phosphoribosyltransferase family protein [Bremerella cremea]RCS47742.1 ComF family protein [Bremerella cremea]